MKRIIRYFPIIVFCIFLYGMSVMSIVYSIKPMINKVREKVASSTNINDIVDGVETEFENNIFQKRLLSSIDSRLTYVLTGYVSSTQVLCGKEKWLFYKSEIDGDPIADYKGSNSYTKKQMNNVAHDYLSIQTYLENKGIKFSVLFAPNKENVYSEFMPDDIVRVSDKTRIDSLVEFLKKNTDVNIVYPKESLLRYKDRIPVFYKYDTHWNLVGGCIVVHELMKAWGMDYDSIEEKSIKNDKLNYHIFAKDDLAGILDISSILDDEQEYIVSDSINIDWDTLEVEQESGMSILKNPNARYHEKILLIGDSFRIAMLPELSALFEQVCVVHENKYSDKIIDMTKPNRIIFERVERYCSNLKIPIYKKK